MPKAVIYYITLNKAVQEAVAWLAAEYKFFEELRNDLAELKKDVETASEKKASKDVKDVKAALKDFQYIGRSERRFKRSEAEVEKMLARLEKSRKLEVVPKRSLDSLKRRLRIESDSLIKNASLFEGRIKVLLLELELALRKNNQKLVNSLLKELHDAVCHSEFWIAALSTDLQAAKGIIKGYYPEDESLVDEKDANLEDFTNPMTRNRLVALMRICGFWNINIQKSDDVYAIIGYYGGDSKRKVMVFQKAGNKTEIMVELARLARISPSLTEKYSYAFKIGKESKAFKLYFEDLLKAYARAAAKVEGRNPGRSGTAGKAGQQQLFA